MRTLAITTAIALLTGCVTTIRPGEVGVRQSFGKLAETHRESGMVLHPVGVQFLRVPIQTQNLEVELELPSREGLNVRSTVSILYAVDPELAPVLLETVGSRYEQSLVMPVFRSASADIAAEYAAKDMYSGQRSAIEAGVLERMNAELEPRGIHVESVLMKSILLPAGLSAAIEEKLAAEQAAERMRFVLEQERLEAERRRIEATGVRDAQHILEEGLSDQILRWRSIEAFQELADSPSTRVIITDGSLPFLIPEDRPASGD